MEPLNAPDEQRLREIRNDLIPRIRPVCPELPGDLFAALIEQMAQTRLHDEELNR